jgi:hypothetical protein
MSDPYGDSAPAILFEEASRVNSKVLMAVIGTSGTGKTPIALALARGVIGPAGKLCVIGTEGDRALFYADRVKFFHVRMLPPYTPDRVADHVEAAVKQGADAIVLDSGSDAYEGIGGERDMADASSLQAPLNWAFPKDRYRKMIQRFVNVPAHMFITFRADEKIEIIDDPDKPMKNGKPQKKIIPRGWTPIWDKRTPYWMQISLMLVPAANLGDMAERRFYRCDDDIRQIFERPGRIDEQIGAELGAWLATGTATDRRTDGLRGEAIEAAGGGTEALKLFWDRCSRDDKLALKNDMAGLKSAAEAVSAERARVAAETDPDEPDLRVSPAFWDRQSYEIPVLFNDWNDWRGLVRAHAAAAPNGECIDKLRDDNTETLAAYGARDAPGYRELLKFISNLSQHTG